MILDVKHLNFILDFCRILWYHIITARDKRTPLNERKVKTMMIKKLSDHRYSQCHVEIAPNGEIYFFSYVTLVCCIDTEGWLECTGTYSQTTRKQIGWFLKEYAPAMTYQMVKQAYQDNMAININTGEVVPL